MTRSAVPDADSFDKHEYVGMPFDRARDRAVEFGWQPRRVTPDMVLTLEFRPGRLNLYVDGSDDVVDASAG